jgi:6-phosphogluconate dehydrogenase
MSMKLGMIGLGRMGGNMARRLLRAGHQVVGFDQTSDTVAQIAHDDGLLPAWSLAEVVDQMPSPRTLWLMLPAGQVTEDTLVTLSGLLSTGDVLIDGGNANFNDSIRRAKMLAEKGIHFLDVGVSGGVWGLEEGYALMIGGDAEVVEMLRPIFETLAPAPAKGWGRVGPSGAGHYTKMVHNGIEYGLMEAYAEGFEIMQARKDMQLDLAQVAELWRYGSVVRSWLLDLTAAALKENPALDNIRGWVADSGEGRWTVQEAVDLDVPAPVITESLYRRFASRQDDSYAAKLLAAMRQQFGGHSVKESGGK